MMKIVPEFEELNKAVRAPNDANGCTARIDSCGRKDDAGTTGLSQETSYQQNIQCYDAPSKVSQECSRSQN